MNSAGSEARVGLPTKISISSVASFLKDVSIISVAAGALFYFFFPNLTRTIANNLNSDQAWYFLGSWNAASQSYYRPRFHSAVHNGLQHESDGLIRAGTILLPDSDYLLASLATGNDDGDVIVGRSDHTTIGSAIRKVLVVGQCIFVDQSVQGKAASINGLDLPTIWVKGVAVSCGEGH